MGLGKPPGIRFEGLCGAEQQSTTASLAWFAARLSTTPCPAGSGALLPCSISSPQGAANGQVGKGISLLFEVCLGASITGLFFLAVAGSQAPSWAPSSAAFALWAGLFWLCSLNKAVIQVAWDMGSQPKTTTFTPSELIRIPWGKIFRTSLCPLWNPDTSWVPWCLQVSQQKILNIFLDQQRIFTWSSESKVVEISEPSQHCFCLSHHSQTQEGHRARRHWGGS